LQREIRAEQLRRLKLRCEADHLYFTQFFFKNRKAVEFLVNWHHHRISHAIQRVIDGDLKNVVINVPPGSSKTELVAINLIARGLAINPYSLFLHISYSDDLTLTNSATAREIVQSDAYQELWPLKIADDAKSKKRWNVVIDGHTAGGVYAVSLGGQITGFRAGRMVDGFQGAIIIDDPLKVDDAYSKTKTNAANRALISTVNSRRANPDTPIIVIMQRVGEEDPTGFIRGKKNERGEWQRGLPGDWEFVDIPALITDEYVSTEVPEEYRESVESGERDRDGRFSYWPYKERLTHLLQLEAKNRFVFTAQYQQRPSPLGGEIIKGEKFVRYKVLPKLKYKKIYGDTAQKTKERNDYSVFECWGLGEDGRIYLVDLVRGKWPAPELKRRAIAFWNKHLPVGPFDPALRKFVIEDKASGTGLIQDIQESGSIPVEGIERNIDKLTRVMDGVPYIDSGLVCIPEDAPFTNDFVAECESFTADDSHAHDDQIDPTMDAIKDMLAKKKSIYDVL
jgi:predicted phage terminase large subunit-like protein